jgi:hypothetical protein
MPGWMRRGGSPVQYLKADPEQEKQALKREAAALQSELDLIKKRLDELESTAATA